MPLRLVSPAVAGLLVMLLAAVAVADEQDVWHDQNVFIGTYTSGGSEGIYVCGLDLEKAWITTPRLAARAANPSFLAIHPYRRLLFAVNEVADFQGNASGAVSVFAMRRYGQLELLNQQSTRGAAPCHLTVDVSGRNVLVANYTGGSVCSLPIRDNGTLGPVRSLMEHRGSSVDSRRQTAPHAHSINLDPGNRFAIAADLGLDQLLIYRFQDGRLTPHDPAFAALAPGTGPRHFAFHPGGRLLFAINELDSTITSFRYDGRRGRLEKGATVSTLPERFRGTSHTAEVVVHPNGRFVYGSNRGHDSLAVFRIDEPTGNLQLVDHQLTGGQTPRNFTIEPSGRLLLVANQRSGTVLVFRIDAETGRLTASGHLVEIPSPVCIRCVVND